MQNIPGGIKTDNAIHEQVNLENWKSIKFSKTTTSLNRFLSLINLKMMFGEMMHRTSMGASEVFVLCDETSHVSMFIKFIQ